MGRKISLLFVFISIVSIAYFGFSVFSAHAATGVIDASNKYATLLDIDMDSDGQDDQINFGNFTDATAAVGNVVVTDDQLYGYIWGETTGWISLNCNQSSYGGSDTCSSYNFKVTNDGSGNLAGYAWGENVGWISFSCSNDAITSGGSCSVGNNSKPNVAISSSNGQFSGHAWGETTGWILFDCTDSRSCVQTTWRPTGGGNPNPPSNPPPSFPQCNDGVDNDGDGLTDWPNDPGCDDVFDDNEFNSDPEPPAPPAPEPDPEPEPPAEDPEDPIKDPSDPIVPPVVDPGTPPSSGGGNLPGPSTGGSTPINDVISQVSEVVASAPGSAISKIIATAGAIAGIVAAAIALALSPLSLVEFALLPTRLWNLLLSFLGLKKRHKPWGRVYDAITKQPLDPAYVTLFDMNGKEVASAITDLDGRYGFLVPPGMYRMTVRKTHYTFPSQTLSGKDRDELYNELYFGGTIEVTESGQVIKKNIPMDPEHFDWNEFEKGSRGLTSFFSKRDVIIQKIVNILFVVGFAVAIVALIVSPVIYNIVVVALYGFMLVLRILGLKPKTYGYVGGNGKALSYAIVRVFSVALQRERFHRVTDENGRYYILVPKGEYYLTIEKKNRDGSYTHVFTSEPMKVRNGVINKNFNIPVAEDSYASSQMDLEQVQTGTTAEVPQSMEDTQKQEQNPSPEPEVTPEQPETEQNRHQNE